REFLVRGLSGHQLLGRERSRLRRLILHRAPSYHNLRARWPGRAAAAGQAVRISLGLLKNTRGEPPPAAGTLLARETLEGGGMVCRIDTGALLGVEVSPVRVEADVSGGLPGFFIVGKGDRAVAESRHRVGAA